MFTNIQSILILLPQVTVNVTDSKQSEDGELGLEWLEIVQVSASIFICQYL